ncbi:Protein CBG26877 [Caenorhabditis briggsae]|uniref:Protein CBG26877 n=1 Tax=Caenorhabditis briggsae TaxID=6238 RepID=B6II77_CAEBR|nr:Protein CBG26877 [Caenorhabditis briggsae]CAR99607.1 Protein CBG26877 [Caenorhabditis briggsae]
MRQKRIKGSCFVRDKNNIGSLNVTLNQTLSYLEDVRRE